MGIYRTIVLSGGGAKGPYGLGVLLALEKLKREREKEVIDIFCGTSVGALNATLAAQGQLAELDALYGKLRNENILGSRKSTVSKVGLLLAAFRKPFHYFKNDALRETIEKYVDFDRLQGSHLLICATNYTSGDLETFYCSDLVDEFISQDRKREIGDQQLANYHRLNSKEEVVQALLASTAIPFYFPPVKIGGSLYVDGGVGNNTPLRQAAYLCRYLKGRGDDLWPTFCVINDPLRFTIDTSHANDIFGVVGRTLDLFHNEIVRDAEGSWRRINQAMKNIQARHGKLSSQIGGMDVIPAETRQALLRQVEVAFDGVDRTAPRCQLAIEIVRPSAHLVDNILEFSPANAKRLKRQGIADCLSALHRTDVISPPEERKWNETLG
jgi:predicted acylesterase/phospholipase RssA